jgi:MGT family glycosyltransferase
MSTKRILFITWDGGGVVPPELGLARRLVERGHEVRVLADPTIEDEATAAGCHHESWTTAPHVTSRTPADAVIKDWEHSNPLKMMKTYLRDFLADPAPRWAADVERSITERPVDVAVVDFALAAASIPLQAHGVPIVGVMPNIWILPTKGIPPIGPGFAPRTGPVAGARDAVMRAMTTRLFDRAVPALNDTRASYGLPPIRSTYEQMLAGSTMLVLTSPAFDLTSSHQPTKVRYAGPVLDDPAWAGEWRSPWPDDERPIVLASLSSGYQDQLAVLRSIATALAGQPVRAVITTGHGIEPSDVPVPSGPGHVTVMTSAPHRQVLAQAAAVITHGGHGTTIKALAAGVPLVCLPMGRDQNDTAARVEHRGVGVRLKPTASPDAIARALRRVIDEPTFRSAAAALGDTIRQGTGCVDPIATIEAAAVPVSL